LNNALSAPPSAQTASFFTRGKWPRRAISARTAMTISLARIPEGQFSSHVMQWRQ
jgi:hypothetical protein